MQQLAEEAVFREITAWFRGLDHHTKLGYITYASWKLRERNHMPMAIVLSREYLLNEFNPSSIEGIDRGLLIRFIHSCINLSLDEAVSLIRSMFLDDTELRRYLHAHLTMESLVIFNRISSIQQGRAALSFVEYSTTFANAPLDTIDKEMIGVPWSRVEEALGRDGTKLRGLMDIARRRTDYLFGGMYPRLSTLAAEGRRTVKKKTIFLMELHPYLLLTEKKMLFNGLMIRHTMGKCLIYDINYKRARENARKRLEGVIA